MKSTKDIIKRILLEQAPSEAEEYSPPKGPHNDYYDVGLALRRIVLNKDTGEWIDTDYLEEESIQTSWDLKEAEQMYQKKLYELKFFDTKGKIRESRDYSDKEQVKDMIADNLTNEIISMLDYGDRMGMDVKLTYEDLNDILTNVFENAEFLFMNDDSYLNEQKEFEAKGMDFWLEELSEFAIHLENGVYDKHDELSHDDLTEYDIGEIQQILEDAMEDKSLNDNERTLVFEYGQGIIDSIQRKIY